MMQDSVVTWTNNREMVTRTRWSVLTVTFIASYGIPEVTNLPIYASDHSPILCENSTNMRSKSRFHYMRGLGETSWLQEFCPGAMER